MHARATLAALVVTAATPAAALADDLGLPVLTETRDLAMQMAIADGHLYVRGSTSELSRISLDDGTSAPLVATGVGTFAIDGGDLYYTLDRELWRMPRDGGAATLLATAPSAPVEIALDARHAYFVTYDRAGVYRVPRDGGAVETIVARRGYDTVAIDAGFVYLGNWTTGTISRVPKRGGHLEVLARKQRPVDLLVDDRNVYWTSESAGEIRAIRKPGKRVRRPAKVRVLARDVGADTIALHDGHVYWQGYAGDGARSLARVGRDGGDAEVLAAALPYPGAFATSGDRAYVGLDGRIVTIAP